MKNYQEALRQFTQSKTVKVLNQELVYIRSESKKSLQIDEEDIDFTGQDEKFENNIYTF